MINVHIEIYKTVYNHLNVPRLVSQMNINSHPSFSPTPSLTIMIKWLHQTQHKTRVPTFPRAVETNTVSRHKKIYVSVNTRLIKNQQYVQQSCAYW